MKLFRRKHKHRNYQIDTAYLAESNSGKKTIIIFNLSSRKLSKYEMSVLSRGLKFTPTPDKSKDEQLANDVSEFHRKLKLKEYFHENENIQEDDSLVRNNSYFEPPEGRNQSLDEYIEITKVIPRNDTKGRTAFNITHNERKALDNLTKTHQ